MYYHGKLGEIIPVQAVCSEIREIEHEETDEDVYTNYTYDYDYIFDYQYKDRTHYYIINFNKADKYSVNQKITAYVNEKDKNESAEKKIIIKEEFSF